MVLNFIKNNFETNTLSLVLELILACRYFAVQCTYAIDSVHKWSSLWFWFVNWREFLFSANVLYQCSLLIFTAAATERTQVVLWFSFQKVFIMDHSLCIHPYNFWNYCLLPAALLAVKALKNTTLLRGEGWRGEGGATVSIPHIPEAGGYVHRHVLMSLFNAMDFLAQSFCE